MRAFIACDIIDKGIQGIVEEIKKTEANIKFVEPKNTHITLKFLGDIDENQLEPIGESIEKACLDLLPLDAHLSGVGVFPSYKYMRVLWIGVECPELIEIQKKLDDFLIRLGYKKEKKFKPHLTIGRIRSGKNKERLKEAVEKLKDKDIGKTKIRAIKLKKSRLTPKGPIYTDLKVTGK